MTLIDLVQDRDTWPAVVNVGFRKMRGICGLAEGVVAPQGTLFHGICHLHRLRAHKIFSERPSSCRKTYPCLGPAS
jgi:hypothetical protein